MNYEEIANEVIRIATEAGAEAEAYLTDGTQTQITVSRHQVEKLSYAGSKGLGVRIIRDGRMGYAFTSDFSPDSVQATTEAALALVDAVDADEFRQFPEPHAIPDEELAIFDPAATEITPEEKVNIALALEKAAFAADERVKVVLSANYVDGLGTVYLQNSRGFKGSYQQSFAAIFTMTMAMDGEERAMGMAMGTGRSARDLKPDEVGTEAGQKAARLLGGRPVPTQEASVVFSPFAAGGIMRAMSQALNGEAMQKGRSFLHGKMGEDVASDNVSILDNGRLPGGFATRPFDDEGNPTSATRLIDEGVLQALLFDTYSAAREGTSSTGNANRGSHRSAPGLSASNFYLQPGHMSADEVIGSVEKGLYVVNVMNQAAINPISGDYSVSAQGFWIEDGKQTFPVNNVTIAIPLDQMLNNISAIGDDLLFLPFGGALGTPTFRVDGVMIGGTS